MWGEISCFVYFELLVINNSCVRENMKYFFIPFIALGLGFSLIFGIEYSCSGGVDILPDFYGHPFVFKYKSMATSLEYHFNLIGVIINTAFWSVLLILLRIFVLWLIKWSGNKPFVIIVYKAIVGLLLFFTIITVLYTVVIEMGSDVDNIDFYWSMNKMAHDCGCSCSGKLLILK